MYSEKAKKFSKISTMYIFVLCSNSQIYGGDFGKFCGLFRIYELYKQLVLLFLVLWCLHHNKSALNLFC